MAQYIVFFKDYSDLVTFDSENKRCLLVGPISILCVQGEFYLSPFGEEIVTSIVTTNIVPLKYRVGNELFNSFTIISEDVNAFKKILTLAHYGKRLLTYSEYGFLNHVKYAEDTHIGILAPNSKKVLKYLEGFAARFIHEINPTHEAILIWKKFNSQRQSHLILAHSVPIAETGQEIMEHTDCWFNHFTEEQRLFKEDVITPLSYNAVFNLDDIANI